MVDDYSSAERRANAKKQLRDRKGRWILMGGKVRFLLNGAYAVGEVTDIVQGTDTVSVKTPDGKTHKLGSKTLENVGAKASLPGKSAEPVSPPAKADLPEDEKDDRERAAEPDAGGEGETPSGPPDVGGEPDSGDASEEGDFGGVDLDAQIIDLQTEEDVLKEDGADKEEIRKIRNERLALQRQRADLDNTDNEKSAEDEEPEEAAPPEDDKEQSAEKDAVEKFERELVDVADWDRPYGDTPGGGPPSPPT